MCFHHLHDLSNGCWHHHRLSHWIETNKYILIDIEVLKSDNHLIDMIYSDAKCDIDFKRTRQNVISYDSRPQHVAIADFNGDNYQDLLIVNTAIDQIAIRFGHDNNSFGEQISYFTGNGSRPYWVAVQDFNNDHLLDIAVANYGSHSIGIFLADGYGNVSNQITFSLGAAQPVSLDIGHFNDDNEFDIVVVTNATFDLTILYGRGDGSFEMGRSYSMGYDSMPCSIVVADLNRDNRSDIIVVNYGTSELVLFLSDENSTFISNSYSTGTNTHPSSVVVDYLDNDGYLDIAVANSVSHTIGIFLGDGSGQLKTMKTYLVNWNAYLQSLVAGHFDGDDNCDLAVIDSRQSYVIIFRGNKDGVFTAATYQSTGEQSEPYSMVAADLNRDNQSDLIIVNNGVNDVLLFNSYTFRATTDQSVYSTGLNAGPLYSTVADMNSDGHLDILVTNIYSENIVVFTGLGNGTFKYELTISLPAQSDSHATGDFNKDGRLDIVVLISTYDIIEIYFRLANGSFEDDYAYILKWNSQPKSVVIADFDNDDNLDIAIGNYGTNDVAILLGLDNGSFLDPTYYNLTENDYSPLYIATADLNNDGFTDLVVANENSPTITILFNDQQGAFLRPESIDLVDYYAVWIAIGDVNNDGQPDIILTSTSNNVVLIFQGIGDGTFSEGYTYIINESASLYGVVLGNFNKDDILDIAVIDGLESSVTVALNMNNKNSVEQNIINLQYGYSPYSMAAGDFNNDNLTDIVVVDIENSLLIVLLMKYGASFANERTYDQGSGRHSYSITMGDFDNDNQSDIAVANAGRHNVEILMEYRDGTFRNNITLLTGKNSSPRAIVTGDFDRNGRLDFVVVNYRKHNLMVVLNPCNETSNESFVYSTGVRSFPNAISTGDFNKDGWTDIVVTNSYTDTIAIFLGFSYPTFAVSYSIKFSLSSYVKYVTFAHFNNDSLWDLVVVLENTNTIQVLTGQSNESFEEQSSCLVCSANDVISLVTGDFNNDNHTDLAVACSSSATLQILLGDGIGGFPVKISESTGDMWPLFITSGDFNRDGRLDIVTANYWNDNISIFLGYGNGSFAKQVLYKMPRQSGPVWIASGDLNNDNILDLVVANKDGDNVRILFGSGDGTFNKFSEHWTGNKSTPCSIALGDFDKDNYTDIAVLNAGTRRVAIFFGRGNDTFWSAMMYLTKQNAILTSIVAEDLNNDSILDLAVVSFSGGSGNIDIFYGLGARRFLVAKTYSTDYAIRLSSIAVKDLNDDGRMDIVIGAGTKDKIDIMLANASEPFGAYVLYSTGIGSGPCAVAVSDLNNDDRLDLAVANSKTSVVLIYLGNGNGYFSYQKSYRTGVNAVPTSLVIGDIDGDKQLDILVTNSNLNEIGIFFNYGNGTFSVVRTYPIGNGSEPSSIGIADLNRDGVVDIVVANLGISTIVTMYGSGNKTFLQHEPFSSKYNYRPKSVAIGDVNNDGWLDVGVVYSEPGIIDVLLHSCDRGRPLF